MTVPPTPQPAADEAQAGYATILTTEHDYRTVDTDEQLAALVERLGGVDRFCFDTETSGIDPLQSDLVGLSFAVEPHEAWWVPTPTAERRARSWRP